MAKTFKQRVKIGVDESKTPIYKWAVGHSIDEMNDAIVRIYVEHGLIDKFLHADRSSIPSKKEIPKFKPYALNWFDTYKRTTLKPTTLQGYLLIIGNNRAAHWSCFSLPLTARV